ncbi:MAG TPA: formate dehydrogenase accessory sulfurtransferase FdhD, partial [Candidatus Nanopelagicales bacterium]|nr:formate dehydrogenase accessory sulfurtransferase FdhD [Candidatus Nanopelagicales bacterium]
MATQQRDVVTGMASRRRVQRIGGPGAGARADFVVVEEPLQVHLLSQGVRTLLGSTMRTPGHDLELAVGLAVGEGLVREREQVRSVRHCATDTGSSAANDVTVQLADDHLVDLAGLGRVGSPTSACGVCGRDQVESVLARVRPVARPVRVD